MSAIAVAGLVLLGVLTFIGVAYVAVRYWINKKLGEWS